MAFNMSCGASASQDARFGDKMKKLLKTTKFPPEFDTRIDMRRVKLEVLLPWINQQVSKYLGFEDEVVIGYVESQLQGESGSGKVDPKQMQLYLTGFLEQNTSTFMKDLWALLISAQNNELGVPTEFLERKKEEIRQKKEEQDRIAAALKAKRDEVERQMAEVDQRRRDQDAGEAPPADERAERREPERRRDYDDRRDGRRPDYDRRDRDRDRGRDYDPRDDYDRRDRRRDDERDRDRRDRDRDRDRDRRVRDRDRDRDRDRRRDDDKPEDEFGRAAPPNPKKESSPKD